MTTIYSDHVVVLPEGVAKVVDRSTDGKNLHVTFVAFGRSGLKLHKVLASTARLATAAEIAASPFAKEFHLAPLKEK